MTRFRPCIDLHAGAVKQIVGGTLSINRNDTDNDNNSSAVAARGGGEGGLKTNFTSEHPAGYYAELYRQHNLRGGHVIMLGPGNESAAQEALRVWRGGLQVGGGINDKNARKWIEAGAEKVIITSFLFPSGEFSLERLEAVLESLGNDKDKLVIDLSCRRVGEGWRVAMNKWQTITDFAITAENIALLEPYCGEFLIHAADAEGLQAGIDERLVELLAEICTIPVTYAGGGRNLDDLALVERLSAGKVDLTIGSALDIFGGKGVTIEQCCEWNRQRKAPGP